MAKIKVGKLLVDVADLRCSLSLECFTLGYDKGSFVKGRGYTNYHPKEIPVCMTRHTQGCPSVGVCEVCRTHLAPYTKGVCNGIFHEKDK